MVDGNGKEILAALQKNPMFKRQFACEDVITRLSSLI